MRALLLLGHSTLGSSEAERSQAIASNQDSEIWSGLYCSAAYFRIELHAGLSTGADPRDVVHLDHQSAETLFVAVCVFWEPQPASLRCLLQSEDFLFKLKYLPLVVRGKTAHAVIVWLWLCAESFI